MMRTNYILTAIAALALAHCAYAAISPAAAPLLGDGKVESTAAEQDRFMQQYAAHWNATAPEVLSSGQVQVLPKIEKALDPIYPPEKHLQGVEATITIEFVVNKNGDVVFATPIDVTADNFSFSASAMVAVWQWKFSPAYVNGTPVDVRMRVPVMFKLRPR